MLCYNLLASYWLEPVANSNLLQYTGTGCACFPIFLCLKIPGQNKQNNGPHIPASIDITKHHQNYQTRQYWSVFFFLWLYFEHNNNNKKKQRIFIYFVNCLQTPQSFSVFQFLRKCTANKGMYWIAWRKKWAFSFKWFDYVVDRCVGALKADEAKWVRESGESDRKRFK